MTPKADRLKDLPEHMRYVVSVYKGKYSIINEEISFRKLQEILRILRLKESVE